MNRFIKILLVAVVSIIFIAIIALFSFDPNILKPRIEALAKQQQLALTLEGDISWTLWPSIGVEINQLQLAPASQPTASIVQLEQAQLLVALMPLFKGEFNVHHVLLKGAVINLQVDKNGVGNWAELLNTKTDTLTDTGTDSDQPQALQLAIEKISIIDSALTFQDQQNGQQFNANNIQLTANNYNSTAAPFSLQVSVDAVLNNSQDPSAKPFALSIALAQTMQISTSMDSAQISDGVLKLVVEGKPATPINIHYSLQAQDLNDSDDALPQLQGSIKVLPFNLKNLLSALDVSIETSESYALNQLTLNTDFNTRDNQVHLKPLNITLDKTRLQGTVAIVDIDQTKIAIDLQGDRINLDHYMAAAPQSPAAKTGTAVTTPAATGSEDSSDEAIIPLDTLKSLNASFKLALEQLTVNQLLLENIAVNAVADNGLLRLNNANANAYQGTMAAEGSLDARGDTAVIEFHSTINQLQLEPLLKVLAPDQQLDLTGGINLDAQGKTRGLSTKQLFDNLTSEIHFSGAQVRFAPLNIEQKFCQLVVLLDNSPDPAKDWAQFTQMQALNGSIKVAKGVIRIENFDASVEQLTLGTQGSIDLLANHYDLRLPLTLRATDNSQQTDVIATSSPQGCQISDNYWLNRSLSLLRCQGSLLELDLVKDCRPDQQALSKLGKDYADYKLRQKHGDKIDAAEQKLKTEKQRLYKKLDEKLGPEGGQSTKDLLRGLIKK